MKIALLGASGMLGSRIRAEAESRGHRVTPLGRHTDPAVDVTDPAGIATAVAGHDLVISAVGPVGEDPRLVVNAAHALADGLPAAGVDRLLVVGGAGGLEVAPGVQLLDTPDFPAGWRPVAEAHRAALAVYQRIEDVNWTYVAPAALIAPGQRTGTYRIGEDRLLVGPDGQSRISTEDFAVAMVDEVESSAHPRRRITVAY
jgi:uncharacterized protein